MRVDEGVGAAQRLHFNAMFTADWLLGPKTVGTVMPHRWDKMHDRLPADAPAARTRSRCSMDRTGKFTATVTCGRPNPIAMQLGISRTREKKSHFSVHLNK